MLSKTNMTSKIANNLFTIKQLMNYWINYKYCPVVKVIRDYNDPMLSIKIRIVNFDAHFDTLPDYYLLVPVTYTTQTYHNFTYTSNMLLDHRYSFRKDFNFKENGWILFNIQQTGKYTTNLLHFTLFIIHIGNFILFY